MNELTKEVASLFESLKHVNEDGVEYWSARELYPILAIPNGVGSKMPLKELRNPVNRPLSLLRNILPAPAKC